MEFEKIQPNIWKPENVGDQIEGKLINSEASTKYEKNFIYHLETKDGKQVAIFGTTVLDDRMKYIKLGDMVRIVFQGVIKNKKGQDMKSFDVYKGR